MPTNGRYRVRDCDPENVAVYPLFTAKADLNLTPEF